ncbi:MAG: zinc ribbon domain-containing protein [Psychrosphaera sp.]|nr:zinc ribbon domain-containing protein [Psychrosphaera sp.]
MISAKRYGCSTARNKGSCDNRMTIARTKIENTVLNALQGQLMQPELFEAFSKEYTAHMSTLSQRQNQSTELAKAKLEKLASAKANIITAIREGIPAAAVKDELIKIEAEREETKITLLKDTPKPIEIKANMAERYREKITNLCANLNQEDTRQEAADLIRNLVEKVTIQPDKYGTQLELTLYGDLAGMLSLASDSEAPQPVNLAFNDEVATQLPKDLQYLLTTAENLTLS